MATLRLLVPDGTTNYIKNPAFRYAATDWFAVGSAIARTLDQARFNIASLQVSTQGLILNEGCYYRTNDLAGISDPISASVYVRGSGIVRLRLYEGLGGQWWSEDVTLSANRWKRIEVSGFSTGKADIRLYVETSGRQRVSVFYVDGAQIERKPSATTYCDGNQPDCYWNVIDHGSISTRPDNVRSGGRWVNLGGCGRDEDNLYFTVLGGLGMAPIRNDVQSYADSPGSYFQGTKILSRVITISFFAKNYTGFLRRRSSLKELHNLRQMLLDILKPDLTAGSEEFVIEYQDGTYPLYFRARYEGGLEGQWDTRNQWVNSFPVRLLAVSPMFEEDDQEVYALSIRSRKTVNFIVQRRNGVWLEMNGGLNDRPLDMKVGSAGEIVVCGNFTQANTKVGAIDAYQVVNYICYWDGTQFRRYGVGANAVVNRIAVAANGDLYVVGAFTSIGGVACNRVARWVKATSSWQALGSGLNAEGWAIAIAPNGDVYVGGDFTTAGGNVAAYIARWDGGSWHPLGAHRGFNSTVRGIAISRDGSQVFCGGSFNDENGAPAILDLNYVALYSPLFDQFYEMGDGFNNWVYALRLTESGVLYAVGTFTEAGNLTGQTLAQMAYWNGAQWFDMAASPNGLIIQVLDVSPSGMIAIGGDFTRVGDIDTKKVALWNRSAWVPLDTWITDAASNVVALLFDRDENLYMGTWLIADFSIPTDIANSGSAEVSPVIYIVGPGTVKWIENQTTKKRIYADLDVLVGEEVIIDVAHGSARSTIRGDLSYTLLGGSDFRSFRLAPGSNKIVVMMVDDVQAKMTISYVPRHWSADATNRIEAF